MAFNVRTLVLLVAVFFLSLATNVQGRNLIKDKGLDAEARKPFTKNWRDARDARKPFTKNWADEGARKPFTKSWVDEGARKPFTKNWARAVPSSSCTLDAAFNGSPSFTTYCSRGPAVTGRPTISK